ncbi:MAG: hypothetical protein QM757_26075 [Paludibaculum sp.]
MKSALESLAGRLEDWISCSSAFTFDAAWPEIARLLPTMLRECATNPAGDADEWVARCQVALDQPAAAERIDGFYLNHLRATTPAKESAALDQARRIRTNAMRFIRAARCLSTGEPDPDPAVQAWAASGAGRLAGAPPMRIPVMGHYRSRGFLAALTLVRLQTLPPVAIEHADLALEPLGAQLLETVGAQASAAGVSFLWHLNTLDPLDDEAAPLDGDSLGAALFAGADLLARHRTYHPGRLLIARVLPDGLLARTGFEPEKLARAAQANFAAIGIAQDSSVGEATIQQLHPARLCRLRTAREAVEFAASTPSIPLL